MRECAFQSIDGKFNFGRYNGFCLAEVLEVNPSYLDWCIKYCTGVIIRLYESAVEEIKILYPKFVMDALFESHRLANMTRSAYDNSDDWSDDSDFEDYAPSFDESQSYSRYSNSWAQEVEGYSDDDIDTIFDGDPDAYWNID